jgi:hypothetical protein
MTHDKIAAGWRAAAALYCYSVWKFPQINPTQKSNSASETMPFRAQPDISILQPVNGPPYRLLSRRGARIAPTEGTVMASAMNTARLKLNNAIAITQARINGAVEGAGVVPVGFGALLEYAFRPGANAATVATTLNAVLVGLQQISAGLNAGDLEIVDSNPNRGGVASGYVRMNISELVTKKDPARPRDNLGRIHIRLATYGAAATAANINGAASTLVHEASHKFVGTRDWGYMAEGAAAYLAMVAMNLPPVLGGGAVLTNAEALNNADSYTAFVMAMP